MGTGGQARIAHQPDHLSLAHHLAALDQHLAQMTVEGTETEGMIQQHHLAVTAGLVVTGIFHHPIGGGNHLVPGSAPVVQPFMEFPLSGDRRLAPAKTG